MAKPWTDAELAFLAENYHKLGYKATAEALGRTGPSVRGMAKRHGIARKKPKPAKVRFKHQRARCPYCGRLHYGARGMLCLRCAMGVVEIG